ncbi:glucan endo-1,3-beta-glucosidase 11 [Nicotiana attenuata]|uniref:Glucan endo-1,3-beta-glucosidase 11 n=1 Tax=Nicotiana attenuata TaxID=49451 RepID=A0A1J6IFP3_NICAT|nr:glucan endo-1,3-beta-glucosidase 11 [Nicotiana attenuata]
MSRPIDTDLSNTWSEISFNSFSISNLMKLIGQKKGTPMRPNSDLNIYVFALFNENLKPGPSSERNYGLFKPDRSQAYLLGFLSFDAVSTNSSSSGGHSGFGREDCCHFLINFQKGIPMLFGLGWIRTEIILKI